MAFREEASNEGENDQYFAAKRELAASVQEMTRVMQRSLAMLATDFYANPDPAAWQSLALFFEQLESLQKSLLHLDGSFTEMEKLPGMLEDLFEAMRIKDSVSVADSLTYQWLAWLREVERGIGEMIL